MLSTWFTPLVVLVLFNTALCQQYILNSEERRYGVLRRFSVPAIVPDALKVAQVLTHSLSGAEVLIMNQAHDLDVWRATDSFLDIYSPPDYPLLPDALATIPHTSTQILTSVPKQLRSNLSWNLSTLTNTSFHDTYHPLQEVESFLEQLVTTYPNVTRLTNLGHSAEGREMFALTISSGEYKNAKKKKKKKEKERKGRTPRESEKLGFVIVGAQHAREVSGFKDNLYTPIECAFFSGLHRRPLCI